MRHVKITLTFDSIGTNDVLIALLSEIGYEGFEEEGEGKLLAYIPEGQFKEDELIASIAFDDIRYTTEFVEQRNWNELWEASFEPVVVDGFCTIRAHFHTVETTTPHEIIITPKMSFGTGHHATTQLMVLAMKEIDFSSKKVLDFGTGTGVLAILAARLGAKEVMAIDNDEWSVDNTKENIERNKAEGINVALASLEGVGEAKYDIILANINRHILLDYMINMYYLMEGGATLVMSGLLAEDETVIANAAINAGFLLKSVTERGGWISIIAMKE